MNRFLRFAPLIVIGIGLLLFYILEVDGYLTIETIRMCSREIEAFILSHPIYSALIFCSIYITLTALSAPGAVFLTLIGGYFFPQPYSTLLVVFSATIGATLIFLAAQTAVGESLRVKASPYLQRFEKGIQNNSASYLLFLRFVPLFPFWLVNIAPAFFNVPLSTFIWTTFVGIIPGTLVFTLVGGGLGDVVNNKQPFSPEDILNPQIITGFFLLGVIALTPIFIKKFKKIGPK